VGIGGVWCDIAQRRAEPATREATALRGGRDLTFPPHPGC